jgi:hypothetical protein
VGRLKVVDSYIVGEKLVENWNNEHTNHINNVKKLAKKYYKELFLVSAGPLAKIFIHAMYLTNPENIYCDIGSALDLFTKNTISRACYKKNHPDSLHSCNF